MLSGDSNVGTEPFRKVGFFLFTTVRPFATGVLV